jgi:hypothetical protein
MASQKKTKLTLEQHRAIGLELAVMRDRLGNLWVKLANGYPYRQVEKLNKAIKLIDVVRCEMDTQVYREFPNGEGFESLKYVYYPTQEKRQEVAGDKNSA